MTNLKIWRQQNRMTQAQAAKFLRLGLSAYCLLEAGRLAPSPAQAARLERRFGPRFRAMLEPLTPTDATLVGSLS